METVGIILILIIAFIVLGLLGWGLKILGWVFDFLWEGCSTSLGCLFWVFVIFLIIIGLAL